MTASKRSHARGGQRGLSLVELMVAVSIGSIVLAAAVAMLTRIQRTSTAMGTMGTLEERKKALLSLVANPQSLDRTIAANTPLSSCASLPSVTNPNCNLGLTGLNLLGSGAPTGTGGIGGAVLAGAVGSWPLSLNNRLERCVFGQPCPNEAVRIVAGFTSRYLNGAGGNEKGFRIYFCAFLINPGVRLPGGVEKFALRAPASVPALSPSCAALGVNAAVNPILFPLKGEYDPNAYLLPWRGTGSCPAGTAMTGFGSDAEAYCAVVAKPGTCPANQELYGYKSDGTPDCRPVVNKSANFIKDCGAEGAGWVAIGINPDLTVKCGPPQNPAPIPCPAGSIAAGFTGDGQSICKTIAVAGEVKTNWTRDDWCPYPDPHTPFTRTANASCPPSKPFLVACTAHTAPCNSQICSFQGVQAVGGTCVAHMRSKCPSLACAGDPDSDCWKKKGKWFDAPQLVVKPLCME